MSPGRAQTLNSNPFFFPGGPVGCLLIHGGTGSPAEMRPTGEYLATKGLTVLGVRLAGHGTTPEDLARTTWEDLVTSAEEGLYQVQEQCQHVFVAGFSVGGLLALHLAAHHPLAGAIAMSTPAHLESWQLRVMGIIKHFIKWHHSSGKVDVVDPSVKDLQFSYQRIPVVFGEQVNCLMSAVRNELSLVHLPVLIMQGRCDRTIAADSAQTLFDGLGTKDKEIVWWPHSAHSMIVDGEREAVWARSYAFIVAHSAVPAALMVQ